MVDQCLFFYEINLLFSKNKYLCFLFYSTIISNRIEQTDWIVVEYSDTLISNEGRYHFRIFISYRTLQAEYDRLREANEMRVVNGNGFSDSMEEPEDHDEEMIAEAKLLRQHKGRLESRMRILEDHNKQLEAQLQRLRHLLDQVRTIEDLAFSSG